MLKETKVFTKFDINKLYIIECFIILFVIVQATITNFILIKAFVLWVLKALVTNRLKIKIYVSYTVGKINYFKYNYFIFELLIRFIILFQCSADLVTTWT